MSAKTIIALGTGRIGVFGGPNDMGVASYEGLALVGPSDLGCPYFAKLFLPDQPAGTTGLARRLNPKANFIAMRWDYSKFSKQTLRQSIVRATNPRTSVTTFLQPVDYGPGDGKLIDGQPTQDTGRIADLSLQGATILGLITDQQAIFELILPEVES